MQRSNKWISTGALFLCLGGWVCSDHAVAADPVSGAKGSKPSNDTLLADAAGAAAKTDAAAPASEPAASESAGTDLNGADVNVAEDGTVQLHVRDLDIATTLRLLSLQSHRNIIASKEVHGTVTADLYKVSFYDALNAILKPNGFGYQEEGNFIYVYTQKELDDVKAKNRKTLNRVFRLRYVNAADAAVLVKPLLSTAGQVALTSPMVAGIPDGQTDTGGNNYAADDTLVVNDFPDNLSEIDRVLKDLDVRPKQVLIESTILRANLDDTNALGVDLVTLSGVDFTGSTGAQDAGTVFNQFINGATGGTGTTTSGTSNVTAGSPAKATVGTSFTNDLGIGNRGLSFGFLSSNINIFLRALEETTDTTIVANPKILALNKHRGEVFIGDHIGYLTTTTTQTTTQQTVNFLDTGTKLIFRPNIGDDGYVRLEIHPEDSAGGLNTANLPFTHTTEVTSNLMIPDGRSVLIGGLFREETTIGRGQVPVFGDLPILGYLGRRQNDETTRNETIIIVTPHIINDDTALYTESQKNQEDISRMMLGNRAGLMPWGRDRIAQCWYAKAQEALAKGDKDKALMYCDWAINANHRFIEAIKLREQLTGKMTKEATESSIEPFIRDVIKDDAAANVPDSGGGGHYEHAPDPGKSSSITPPPATPVVPANAK